MALVAAIPATSSATTDPQPPINRPPRRSTRRSDDRLDDDGGVAMDALADTTTTSTADTTSTTTTSATTSSTTTSDNADDHDECANIVIATDGRAAERAGGPVGVAGQCLRDAVVGRAVGRRRSADHRLRRRAVAERLDRLDNGARRDVAGPDDNGVWSDQRGDPLLPGARREHRGIRSRRAPSSASCRGRCRPRRGR